jgi:hypothetical protein
MRNPIRRSRKIGLTQGGRVKDGRALEKLSRVLPFNIWHHLSNAPSSGECLTFEDNPSNFFYHPCRPDEYLGVLSQLPKNLSRRVKAVVLKRTSALEYQRGVEAMRRYACVIINAFPKSNEMVWHGPIDPKLLRHYGRWCSKRETTDKGTIFHWSEEQLRKYYLYHLFLHEVGHINQPWFHKLRRREEFAENFALEWAERLNELPFPIEA